MGLLQYVATRSTSLCFFIITCATMGAPIKDGHYLLGDESFEMHKTTKTLSSCYLLLVESFLFGYFVLFIILFSAFFI